MYIMKLNPKLRLLLIMLTIAISVFSMGMQEKNSLETQLLETWTIHNKMNLFLLAEIRSEYLKDSSSPGGRNVGEQFAHIHENRIAWIKEIAPEEAKDLTPLTQNAKDITKEQLHSELIKSGVAINKILSQCPGYPQLVRKKGGYTRQFQSQAAQNDGLLAPLAEAASDLLCSGKWSLVKKCGNPACILYFYDTTKNHTRNWCSMQLCGNRKKVAAHYQRKRNIPTV